MNYVRTPERIGADRPGQEAFGCGVGALMWLMTGLAAAQNLPDFDSVLVNDFADILSPETETQLAQMLQDARNQRDHEMTVVTINSVDDYVSGASIEAFSKDLFNAWSVLTRGASAMCSAMMR